MFLLIHSGYIFYYELLNQYKNHMNLNVFVDAKATDLGFIPYKPQ